MYSVRAQGLPLQLSIDLCQTLKSMHNAQSHVVARMVATQGLL
jgi:hypothetical protein